MKKSIPVLVLALVAVAGISLFVGQNSATVSADDLTAQQTEEPADANVTPDTEASNTETAEEATIVDEKIDPSTLSEDEKLEIFEWVYDIAYTVTKGLQGIRGEAEFSQDLLREQELYILNNRLNDLNYKVTADIKDEYIFWSDTYHSLDDGGSTVSSETKTQQSTGGSTQQTTNGNTQQNNNTTTQSSTTDKSNSQTESTTTSVNDSNTKVEESQVENENGDVCSGNDAMSLEDWLNSPPADGADPEDCRAHF